MTAKKSGKGHPDWAYWTKLKEVRVAMKALLSPSPNSSASSEAGGAPSANA